MSAPTRHEPSTPPPSTATPGGRYRAAMTPAAQPRSPAAATVQPGRARRRFAASSRLAVGFDPRPVPKVGLLVASSLASGLGEAGLLYLIVRTAAALTSGDEQIGFAIGPLRVERLALSSALAIGGVSVVVLLVLAAVAAWSGARLVSSAQLAVRTKLLQAFLHASWERQSSERLGRLQEMLTTHTEQLNAATLHVATGLVAIFSFVAFFASAMVLNPVASAVMVGAAALVGAIISPIRFRVRRASQRNLQANREFALEATEMAAVLREVRAFGVEQRVYDRMAQSARRAAATIRRLRFLGQIQPRAFQYLALALVLVALAVARQAGRDQLAQIGAVLLILVRSLSYSQQLNSALQRLNEAHPYLADLEVSLRDFEATRVEEGGRPMPAEPSIRLEGVGYRYPGGPPVLRGIDLEIRAGECIGIVGPSGGGKSTLVQLLLRLREPTEGRILVGGVDVREIDRARWTASVAGVPQDNLVIGGTVLENVDFFRGLDDAALLAALEAAHLDAEVAALPEGPATMLGRGLGIDLSGGQRQRLGIARAIAGRPSVIVLDEPTSALDMRSEEYIQQTLRALKGRVTMVVVAHRLSTTSLCDRLVVLRDGRIEAVGTPDEVVRSSEFLADAMSLAGNAPAAEAASPASDPARLE